MRTVDEIFAEIYLKIEKLKQVREDCIDTGDKMLQGIVNEQISSLYGLEEMLKSFLGID